MTQHVKLVEDDQRLRGVPLLEGRVAERLPHVHHRDANFAGFRGPKPGKELVHASFRSVFAAEPNGPAADQIAHHDAVTVASADGDLVDADRLGSGLADTPQLLAHVLLVQLLDRVPIQEQLLGHGFDRTLPAASSHEVGESFRVERIVGQPVEAFGLHGAAPRTIHPANEEVQIDVLVAAGEVANVTRPLIVECRRHLPARPARRFFSRRWGVTTTARGSPKMPWTAARGSNPGNR